MMKWISIPTEAKVHMEAGVAHLWGVRGCADAGLYPNKLMAEEAARAAYPREDAEKRYARIFFLRFTPQE